MLKRRWLLLPLVVFVSVSSAYAEGVRLGGPQQDVKISPFVGFFGKRTASGALGTARLEPIGGFEEKWIGCEVVATPGLPATAGTAAVLGVLTLKCEAYTNTDWLYCGSNDQALISALGAMNSDSKLTFVVDMAAPGVCDSIKIDNSSKYQQKAN
jgi:hypothetical protein